MASVFLGLSKRNFNPSPKPFVFLPRHHRPSFHPSPSPEIDPIIMLHHRDSCFRHHCSLVSSVLPPASRHHTSPPIHIAVNHHQHIVSLEICSFTAAVVLLFVSSILQVVYC